jgi:hypothetical protein
MLNAPIYSNAFTFVSYRNKNQHSVRLHEIIW